MSEACKAHDGAAWTSRRAWSIFVVVAILGTGADLASKWWAFRSIADAPVRILRSEVLATTDLSTLIPSHEPDVVVPGVLELTLVLNSGAVFGLGAGARWFFVVFTVGAIAFVTWAFATQTRERDTMVHVSSGLLIAGGIGNLYDRLLFACVRDFLHPLPHATIPFSSGRALWPYVSNIADAFLIIGIAGLLLFSFVRGGKGVHAHDSARATDQTTAGTNEGESHRTEEKLDQG